MLLLSGKFRQVSETFLPRIAGLLDAWCEECLPLFPGVMHGLIVLVREVPDHEGDTADLAMPRPEVCLSDIARACTGVRDELVHTEESMDLNIFQARSEVIVVYLGLLECQLDLPHAGTKLALVSVSAFEGLGEAPASVRVARDDFG